jgi:hypothetical protein
MSAVTRRARLLHDELIPQRSLQVNEAHRLKTGRKRYQRKRTEGSRTVTISFTGTSTIDQIIDRWAVEYDASRSQVIRGALLLADAQWSRRHGRCRAERDG